MDKLVASGSQTVLGYGICGAMLLFFIWLFLRMRSEARLRDKDIAELHEYYGAKLDNLVVQILELNRQHIKSTVKHTEVLGNLQTLSERIVFDLMRGK